jgi:hypothetical protein
MEGIMEGIMGGIMGGIGVTDGDCRSQMPSAPDIISPPGRAYFKKRAATKRHESHERGRRGRSVQAWGR